MSGSNVGAKALCAVVDTSGNVLPCLATDNGDDTCTLKIDGEFTATIDPALLATAAKQDTGNSSLGNIKTAVETIDNCISGSEAQVDVVAPLPAGTNALGKVIAPTFSVSGSITRPANTTAYAINKSINCNVTVTAMSYSGLTVTLTANNAFSVGDRITVAGVNSGFTVTNIDGNWTCKTGTNATTVVFDVTVQPTGTTPQTVTAGTIAKCLSLDVAGTAGCGVILSRVSVALPGVAMTGAVRCWIYSVQPTVLVDQATFTLLAANDTYRRAYVDIYPVTAGSGSDMCFGEWVGWMEIKPEATDTMLYFRLEAQGVGTPTSAGVITLRASGIQLLG